MSEKKDVLKMEVLGGGLSKEESQKVFGGKPPCYCTLDETITLHITYKNPPV